MLFGSVIFEDVGWDSIFEYFDDIELVILFFVSFVFGFAFRHFYGKSSR